MPVPGAGGGGPPTVSDFDGDGLPEVAVAGQAFYTIYVLDCGPAPRPGGQCNLGRCDFAAGTCAAGGHVLWSKSTQDISSNVTGSSVFDFEADGSSEVLAAGMSVTLEPGDTVVEPPGMVHLGSNLGRRPVVMVAATLFETGAEPATAVETPEASASPLPAPSPAA